MKNLAAISLFILSSFIAAGSATAQQQQVKATIPFTFSLGDQTLPSGTYTITSSSSNPDVLDLRNWDKKVNTLSTAMPNGSSPSHDNELVFHRYGNEYYLSEIRTEDASMNVRFSVTKAEKRARARTEEAGIAVSDPVLIALN